MTVRARIVACVVVAAVAVIGAVGGALGGLAVVSALYPSGGEPETIVRASERLVEAPAHLPEASAAARATQPGVDARPVHRARRRAAPRHVTHRRRAPRAAHCVVAVAVVAPAVVRRAPIVQSVHVVRSAPVARPARPARTQPS
jgi:hypothetical protein